MRCGASRGLVALRQMRSDSMRCGVSQRRDTFGRDAPGANADEAGEGGDDGDGGDEGDEGDEDDDADEGRVGYGHLGKYDGGDNDYRAQHANWALMPTTAAAATSNAQVTPTVAGRATTSTNSIGARAPGLAFF